MVFLRLVRTAAQHAGEARQRHYAFILVGEWMANKNAPSRPGVRPSAFARTTGGCVCDLNLQLDHVEIALGRAAHRTDPVVRNVGPSFARSQTLIGAALFLL